MISQIRNKTGTKPITLMMVSEHGKPYKQSPPQLSINDSQDVDSSYHFGSRMMMREHGQPYKSRTKSKRGPRSSSKPEITFETQITTHMMTKEHGQPYI